MVDYRLIKGNLPLEYMTLLMEWRLKYFKTFPYLYDGNREYEERYLSGFASSEGSILILAEEGGSVVGMVSALPLLSEFDITTETDLLARSLNQPVSSIFYISEVLVDERNRGRGISRKLVELAEKHARHHSYTVCSLLTVMRDTEHPLHPNHYVSTDGVWESLGYRRSGVTTSFEWPTIRVNGDTEVAQNPMQYWVKRL